MDSKADMYLRRAKSEIDAAGILLTASTNVDIKPMFNLSNESTFYSGVISHSYYGIFYCAKAMLLTKKIETESPEIHKKTFDEFKKAFIDTGLLDTKLLMIYQELIIRAETLLGIYQQEKKKRGDFTYNTIPQANKEPADESIRNVKMFYKHCNTYLLNLNNKK